MTTLLKRLLCKVFGCTEGIVKKISKQEAIELFGNHASGKAMWVEIKYPSWGGAKCIRCGKDLSK